jgi:hypothetical protein
MKTSKQQFLEQHLKPGEIYAGLILGEPDYHLIALPLHKDKAMTWDKAMAAAKKAGAALPDCREARLLFINASKHFEQAWYWTRETHAAYGGYAWCQNFSGGDQLNVHKSNTRHVVLLRRVAVEDQA